MKRHTPNAEFETCPACNTLYALGAERPCECDLGDATR